MYDSRLDTFLRIAECGSFNRAAAELFLSPTAIMRQMNQLEQSLGVKLLYRTPHGIALTEAGAVLRDGALDFIVASSDLVDKVQQAGITKKQVIRIGTSTLYPHREFTDLWAQVSANHPEISIKIVPFDETQDKSAHQLLGTKFDILVGPCDAQDILEFCDVLPLNDQPFHVLMSKTHRLAQRKLVSAEDLSGEKLMMLRRGVSDINDELRAYLRSENPAIAFIDTSDYYTLDTFNLCEEDNVLLLSLALWRQTHPALISIELDAPFSLPSGIVCLKNARQEVVDFLQIAKSECISAATTTSADCA